MATCETHATFSHNVEIVFGWRFGVSLQVLRAACSDLRKHGNKDGVARGSRGRRCLRRSRKGLPGAHTCESRAKGLPGTEQNAAEGHSTERVKGPSAEPVKRLKQNPTRIFHLVG